MAVACTLAGTWLLDWIDRVGMTVVERTDAAVLLDLDDTILFDDAATDIALDATAAHAAELSGVDAAALVAAVRLEADELWQAGPHPAWCEDIGTSELEGLRGRFEGDDPHMVAMREWGPAFRRESWRRALGRCGVDDAALAAELDTRFETERAATNPFIPGAEEALAWLAARYRLAIVTNGMPDVQREKLVRAGLLDRFEVVVISGEVGVGKPDRRVYDETLRHLGLSASACLMVGDNIVKDVAGAQAVGIRGVWISAGRPLPDTGIVPHLMVASLAGLPGAL